MSAPTPSVDEGISPHFRGISRVSPLTIGNGESIYQNSIFPVLSKVQNEILLVTCFWAPSPTRTALSELLIQLSEEWLNHKRARKVRVLIGISSQSLIQKIFHTSSSAGHIFTNSERTSKLGLPGPEKLRGIELQVKSIFYLPFSVLHPKIIIVDRQVAIIPSCNISKECWLECCVQLSGPIVKRLVEFWQQMWESETFAKLPGLPVPFALSESNRGQYECETVLLASAHQRNPRFRPWPFTTPTPPSTPLNTYLLQAMADATTNINIVTPNLTSPPVLSALLAALERGVDVQVVTGRRTMRLEQLLTAGTTTERCVNHLVRCYRQLTHQDRFHSAEESQTLGRLNLSYFNQFDKSQGPEKKCHIDCTIIDEREVVLGSGKMERASWYTSQELGVAVASVEAAAQMTQALYSTFLHRIDRAFESD